MCPFPVVFFAKGIAWFLLLLVNYKSFVLFLLSLVVVSGYDFVTFFTRVLKLLKLPLRVPCTLLSKGFGSELI